MTIVCKVLRVHSGKLLSATAGHHELQYERGKFTKAKIGKLFAFDSTEWAIRFAREMQDCVGKALYEIWSAWTECATDPPIGIVRTDKWQNIKMFWKTLGTDKHFLIPVQEFYLAPEGTCLCRSLIILDRITHLPLFKEELIDSR